MKSVIRILCAALLLAAPFSFAEDMTAEQVLKKAEEVYKVLGSYRGKGTVVTAMDMGASKFTTETSFELALKKPNRYRITWSQKADNMPVTQAGAVWNDGEHPYLYMNTVNAYCPMENDALAIGGATGVSAGAAMNLPSLFFGAAFACQTPFSRLTAPVMKDSEIIADDDCYVISSPSIISEEETVWISKKRFLMRQCSRSLEPPEGGRKIMDMSDEQLDENMRAIGQEVTEESKKTYRDALNMMVQMNLKGSMIETHTEALTLDLAPEDLVYSPPEGAKKKESLGQMISLGMAAAGSKCPLSKTASAVPTVSGAGTAQDSTPLPPDLERARAKARVASCANNLKQCGLIIKMFANEAPNQWLPPLAPKSGSPMWLKEAIYPEYLTDPVILLCPAEEEKSRAISELKDFDPKALFAFNNSSYWYLGYAVPDEKTGLAFVEAYRKQVETGGDFTADLQDADGNTLWRLREGVERFFIQDINDPAASFKVQARLPVILERPGQHEGQINVLFMDGHVETRDYPGEFPASKVFIEALASLDTLSKP